MSSIISRPILYAVSAILLFSILLAGCTQAPYAPSQGSIEGSAQTGQTEPEQEIAEDDDEGTEPSIAPEAEPEEVPPEEEEHQPSETTDEPQEETSEEDQYDLKSEEVSFYSSGWTIHGTLYKSQDMAPKKAVILLHQLGEDRSSFPLSFISKIHEAMPDTVVLALDQRGHGESDALGSWEKFDTADFKNMKVDVVEATEYLRDKNPALTQYYLVGASIGSTTAVLTADQLKGIEKIVLLSPGEEYKGVSIEKQAEDYIKPVFMAASKGDEYSYQSMLVLENKFDGTHVEAHTYAGSAHGTDLFTASKGTADDLENLIVDFLD